MIRVLKISVVIFTILYISLAIAGGYLSYSPVPFWDMWNGYLGFYVKASSGDWGVWWANHNEHRIVLSRVLFWLDHYLFSGRLIFLIIANYLLIVAICLVYRKIIVSRMEIKNREFIFFLSLVVYCLLFSWTQSENITWGFQSQFFLAQLLPLLAFYLLFQSAHKNSIGLFVLACLVGFLASMSMANGVIALPLMVILSFFMRLSLNKGLILIILSISSISLYFNDYVSPSGHGSLIETLSTEPFLLLKYILLYLGAPLYYLTGKGTISHSIAQLGGLFLIISSAYFLIRTLRSGRNVNITYVLLTFLLYIGGTALGTAGGRAIFGIEQALTGRYMTPVLMGWIALIILYSDHIGQYFSKKPIVVLGAFLFVQLSLLPAQLHALDNHKDDYFQRLMGSLSLELRAHDKNKVDSIFPSVEWALEISQVPSTKNLSIFSHPLIKDVREMMGSRLEKIPSVICQGALDEIRGLPDDASFVALRGWLFDPVLLSQPRYAHLIDTQQIVVGYVLLGAARPDVKLAVHKEAGYSGFEGYAISDRTGGELKLVSSNCYLPVVFPNLPYVIQQAPLGTSLNVIKSDAVVDVGGWVGSDYYRSTHPDLKVLGTFINSDSDVGQIKLNVNDNESIYYRSGPSSIGQQMIIDNKIFNLPLASDWVLLTFKTNLESSKEVILEDIGSDWGQWSAIAVRSSNATK